LENLAPPEPLGKPAWLAYSPRHELNFAASQLQIQRGWDISVPNRDL